MKLFVEKDTQKIEEEFISAKEAAREFGYNPDYVARLCRKGKFESRRQDRQWYVNRAAAQTFFIAHAERIRKHRNELSRELSAVEIHMPFSGSQELVWHDGLTDYDLRMRVAPRSLRALLALKTRTSHTHALAHSLLNKKTVVGVVVLFLCVFALTSNVSSISTRIPPNVFTAAATSASGSWISQTLCSYFSLCSDSGAALTRAARDRAYEPVIVIEKSKAAAPAVSVQSAPSSVARVVQNITQPVIERIIERASASPLAGSFITDALLVSRLGDLETRLNQRISSIPGPMSGGGSSAPVYINTFGLSQKIDQLDSVTITNPTISGGSVVATSLNGLLGIGNGGTGTTTFTQGWIYSDGGTNTLAASTSPTVLAIIATSTSVASQLPYASSTALTVSGTAYFPAGIWNATGNVGIGTTSPYARLSVAGEAVAAYVSATSTTATSTFAGGILGTRAPTLPHTFSSWLTGASNAQALTAALVVNPASAVADSNLISASVGDSVRFLIDAEGDIFVNNITSVGSVTLSTTSASTFTVEGNTTLGDAITDVTTVNGTLTVAGTTTVASVAGKFGVGSTTPLAKLSVHANDGETNTTLFAVASSTASATTTLFSISNTGAITSTAGSAHTLPYASSTALTISGTASTSNLTVSNTTQLSNNLTGPLQAIGGLVSASSSLSAFYGGTGITSPSAAQILLGSYTGGGWQQLATSSLGLLTTNVTEGTNLYYTDARVQSFVHASSTIPKTYTNNTFTGSNIFSIATTTGKLSSYSFVETPYFNATSTTASQLPYASTTAVTATTASSTNLIVSGATGGLLKTSSAGVVSVATLGTDYVNYAWPFTVTGYGVSTSTTVGFTNGLLSTASSTFTSTLTLSSLTGSGLGVNASGQVYAAPTTTFSSGLTYANGNVTNTGVTSNVAGAGISVSGATGAVTITNTIGYPFPSNATTTGLLLLASTTVGGATQATGLTISGGATTSGFLVVQGTAATSTFAAGVSATSIDTTGGSATSTMRGLRVSSNGLTLSTLTSSLLKTDASGNVAAAVVGTDYQTFAFPFTTGTSFGSTVNSTSTILALTGGLQASSTVRFGNAGVSPLFFDGSVGNLGIGTTSPFAKLSVFTSTTTDGSPLTLFAIGSSTASFATSTLFSVNNIGSTTLFRLPSSVLKTDNNGTIVGAVLGTDYVNYAWPFTVTGYGVSTSTTVGFTNGLLSTASSTFTSTLTLSSLTGSGLGVNASGQVYAAPTTTFSGGLIYANGNVTNSGVTSNVAGAGISVSGATGAVTITNTIGYPFPSNATTTGLLLLASTTVGGATQATGLTISGGATTSGFLVVQGTAATSTFAAGVSATSIDTTGGSATSTMRGLRVSSGGLAVSSLVSCSEALETDASGNVVCGTDATGSGSAFPFTVSTTYGTTTSATTTPLWLQGNAYSLFASSSVLFGTNNNTQFFWSSASGALGIGTTTPWAALSINPNGITGPAFVVGSSTATNFIVTNGGNVGIGTTTPAAKLTIQDGNLYIAGQGGGLDSYTKLLIHADGVDASTTFTDVASTSRVITANGNAQVDTAQSKFGGASSLLDGTGDYLTAASDPDFAFGTGDFTIDFWIRWNSTAGQDNIFNFAANGLHASIYKADGNVPVKYYNGSADAIVGSTAVAAGSWYHVALARASGSTRLFLNGVQEGSTYADSINYTQDGLWIGAYSDGTLAVDGWMDEIRVSKGVARWTSNFTPPTSTYSSVGANAGYIGLGVAAPENPIQHSSGAVLSVGGSWTNASDRNLKENFSAIDPQVVLTGINALDIQKWNYKAENSSITHIGPVAQDFWAQFGLGGSDKTISTIDSAGVALVGVQALSQRLDALATTSTTTAATTTPKILSFASNFFATLFTRITQWLADANNGIGKLFAQAIHAENVYADIATFRQLTASSTATDQLCLGSTCVTEDQLKSMLAASTILASPTPDTSTSTPANDNTPPVITVNGNASSTIDVGSTYVDLGANVTDDHDQNLGIHFFVNGTEVPEIQLDTGSASSPQGSTSTTYSIEYRATDNGGLTATAIRTVTVGAPANDPGPTSSQSPDHDGADNTPTTDATLTPEETATTTSANDNPPTPTEATGT